MIQGFAVRHKFCYNVYWCVCPFPIEQSNYVTFSLGQMALFAVLWIRQLKECAGARVSQLANCSHNGLYFDFSDTQWKTWLFLDMCDIQEFNGNLSGNLMVT